MTDVGAFNLACVQIDKGSFEKAEHHFRESLAIKVKAQGKAHQSTAISLHGLASAFQGQGLLDQALEHYEEAIGIFTGSLPSNHWRLAYTKSCYARCLIQSGAVERGEKLLEECIVTLEHELGLEHPKTREAIETRNLK